MRILVINLEFPWDSDKEVRAVKRQETIEAMESIGIDSKHMPKGWLESSHDFMVTETQLTDLVVWGYRFKVVQQADYGIDNAALTQRISAIAQRLEQVSRGYMHESDTFNDRCGVHVPGNVLSMYNETMLLENCCTDVLQDALDKNWRVMACCPQTDGRRPDYVLARYNPTRVPSEGALRQDDL